MNLVKYHLVPIGVEGVMYKILYITNPAGHVGSRRD